MEEMTLSEFLKELYIHADRRDFGKRDQIRCAYCGEIIYKEKEDGLGTVKINCCEKMVEEKSKTDKRILENEKVDSEIRKANRWREYCRNLESSGFEGFELKADLRTFKCRPETVEAFEMCKEFIDSDKTNLILSGAVGVGKTHLGVSVAKSIGWRKEITFGILRCSSVDTKNDPGDYNRFGVLVIDDIGREVGSDAKLKARRSVVTEVVEFRCRNNMKTIYTTNMSSSELIDSYGSHIFDRMISNSMSCSKIIAESYRGVDNDETN